MPLRVIACEGLRVECDSLLLLQLCSNEGGFALFAVVGDSLSQHIRAGDQANDPLGDFGYSEGVSQDGYYCGEDCHPQLS